MTALSSAFNTRALDALVLIALFVAVWQGLYEYAGDAAITSPLTTLGYASSLVKTSNFWSHAQATLAAFLYALAISIALGVALGLMLGFQRFAGDVAEPILVALYTIPKITLYPLILLVFGLGVSAKVAFGVIHGVIPIILFTLNAVKNINPVLIRTSRVMRLSTWQTVSTVLTPEEMVRHPQIQARGIVVEADGSDVIALPAMLTQHPRRGSGPLPIVGEHADGFA